MKELNIISTFQATTHCEVKRSDLGSHASFFMLLYDFFLKRMSLHCERLMSMCVFTDPEACPWRRDSGLKAYQLLHTAALGTGV